MSDNIRRCCRRHEREDLEAGGLSLLSDRIFIVCKDCGYKRCKKATDCGLDCTGDRLTMGKKNAKMISEIRRDSNG